MEARPHLRQQQPTRLSRRERSEKIAGCRSFSTSEVRPQPTTPRRKNRVQDLPRQHRLSICPERCPPFNRDCRASHSVIPLYRSGRSPHLVPPLTIPLPITSGPPPSRTHRVRLYPHSLQSSNPQNQICSFQSSDKCHTYIPGRQCAVADQSCVCSRMVSDCSDGRRHRRLNPSFEPSNRSVNKIMSATNTASTG